MKRINRLNKQVQLSLFITSYFPLFILIITRQIFQQYNKFFETIPKTGIITAILNNYSLSLFLIIIIIYGTIGIYFSFKNISERARTNAWRVEILNVQNRSGEAISYIGTYIIPFLFQDYAGLYETLSTLFLLYVIYRIYINSSLLLINPVLNLKYSLYEIEFRELENDKQRNGMLITKNKFLEDGDHETIYPIGHKLFIGVNDGTA